MVEHKLCYKVGREWQQLPQWAEFFITLGRFIAGQHREGGRSVVCVAVPTRAFASALAAAGAAVQLGDGKGVGADNDSHFQDLCRMTATTAVTYFNGERNKLGIILGCSEAGGERWLKVQTGHPHNNAETQWVNSKNAHKIQVVPELGVMNPVNLPYNQYGTLITPPTNFTRQVLGDANAYGFTVRSCMRALIVGHLNHLRREMVETPFGVKAEEDDMTSEGSLQELVRARRLYGANNRPYRTDIFPSNSRRAPRSAQLSPPLVIFDGSHGFLRWREQWRDSNWLVILDVTDGNFIDARDAVNGEYITRRVGDEIPPDLPAPPAAVEIVFYREVVNG